MTSQIARTAARYVLTLMLPISLLLLLRGHNAPGGGFIAGIVAGSGLFFYAVAHGTARAAEKLRIRPLSLCGSGLLLSALAAVVGVAADGAVLKSYWLSLDARFLGQLKAGTPLLFDTGVFFTVTGSILLIFLSLIKEFEWR